MLKICFVCNDWQGKLVEAYDGYAHPKCLKRIDRKTLKGDGWVATPSYPFEIYSSYRIALAITELLKTLSLKPDFDIGSLYKLGDWTIREALESSIIKVYYALSSMFPVPVETGTLFQAVNTEMDKNTMIKALLKLKEMGYVNKTKRFWHTVKR
jgi:hypothetical protein